MTPNPFLSPYSSDDINSLIQTGSLSPRFDDHLNLLIDHLQVSMVSSSITIPLNKIIFYDQKVATKFNVTFTELT